MSTARAPQLRIVDVFGIPVELLSPGIHIPTLFGVERVNLGIGVEAIKALVGASGEGVGAVLVELQHLSYGLAVGDSVGVDVSGREQPTPQRQQQK